MSLKRTIKRTKTNKSKKKVKKELTTKIALFGKLPNKCLTCEEPFDKTNKEMVLAWNVVVREQNEIVRLYCPKCWKKALQILDDFKKHIEEKDER